MNVQFKIYKKYNGSNIQRFENGEQCTLKGVTLYVIGSCVKLGQCPREIF